MVPGSAQGTEVAGTQTVVIPAPVGDLMEMFRSLLEILAGAQERGKAGNKGVSITDIYLVI